MIAWSVHFYFLSHEDFYCTDDYNFTIRSSSSTRLTSLDSFSSTSPFTCARIMETEDLECATTPTVSCLSSSGVNVKKMSKAKKTVEEAKLNKELDLVDKNVLSFEEEIPGVLDMFHVTRITLSHNKLKTIPPGLANLVNLEILNLFNNHIEELPVSISSLPKLRILNLGMNKLNSLPRGFGALPALEVLDLTYNNLNEKTLPGNFFMLETLRALYLGDNDFQFIPPQIGQLKNLQILVLRENDLIELPKEIGDLQRLRELHIQANRLTILPPEIGNLDFLSSKSVLRMDFNPWVPPIADQLVIGISHVIDYIRSETYRYLFSRHVATKPPPPPQTVDKSKKISRIR